MSTAFNFDRLHATRVVEARQALLREILPAYVQEHGLRTALDAGGGGGYFSAFLRDMGFEVSAFDARKNCGNLTWRCVSGCLLSGNFSP